MKQEEFEKIAKEANGYLGNIERIATKDLKVYALEGMGTVDAVLNDSDLSLEPLFDITAYINDNFYWSIEQEGYNFVSSLDKRTNLIMSFDDLGSEIELCNTRWIKAVYATMIVNMITEHGEATYAEVVRVNDYLFEAKVQLAIAVESLLDSFFDEAEEEVWV